MERVHVGNVSLGGTARDVVSTDIIVSLPPPPETRDEP
jgi:hypothetical protein